MPDGSSLAGAKKEPPEKKFAAWTASKTKRQGGSVLNEQHRNFRSFFVLLTIR